MQSNQRKSPWEKPYISNAFSREMITVMNQAFIVKGSNRESPTLNLSPDYPVPCNITAIHSMQQAEKSLVTPSFQSRATFKVILI